MLQGLRAPPPAVTVGIIVVVGTVTMVACLVPAVRALRIDPATAFRAE
jgi:ABC-type antimicrobial peptide transport system permease subunit